MARGSCTFKLSDATRLIKATVAAGLQVARVEAAPDGKIIVITGGECEDVAAPESGNAWDEVGK